jgi:hypothetical protein
MDTLADDLLLLVIGLDGYIDARRLMAVGLKATELVRLAASGRVTVTEGGHIAVADPAPMADPRLDAALRSLTGARPPQDAATWCQHPERGIRRVYLNRLAAAGALGRTRFWFVRMVRWRIIDQAWAADARARLDEIALGTGPVGPAQAAYGGLAHATGLAGRLYFKKMAVHERLRQLAKSQRIVQALRPPDEAGRDDEAASVSAAISAAADWAIHAAVSAVESVHDSGGHAGGGHGAAGHGGGDHGGGGHGGGGHI